jgi:repressor LexA
MGLDENLKELQSLRRLFEMGDQEVSFGREVRKARTNRGLTLDALSEATGMAKSYLSQIETGYAPPPRDDKVRRIAEALGLDAEVLVAQAHLSQLPEGVRHRMARLREIFDKTEESIRELKAASGKVAGVSAAGAGKETSVDLDAMHSSGLLHHLAEWGDKSPPDSGKAAADRPEKAGGLRNIPIINKVAAGYPQEFTDLGYPVGVADDYVSVPTDLSDPNAFAVRVVGDSMEPKYHEGDIVILSPAAGVRSGDDCFVRFGLTGGPRDGEVTFKRVFFDPGDVVRLQPINEHYAPAVVQPKQIAGIFRAVARYEKL